MPYFFFVKNYACAINCRKIFSFHHFFLNNIRDINNSAWVVSSNTHFVQVNFSRLTIFLLLFLLLTLNKPLLTEISSIQHFYYFMLIIYHSETIFFVNRQVYIDLHEQVVWRNDCTPVMWHPTNKNVSFSLYAAFDWLFIFTFAYRSRSKPILNSYRPKI